MKTTIVKLTLSMALILFMSHGIALYNKAHIVDNVPLTFLAEQKTVILPADDTHPKGHKSTIHSINGIVVYKYK